MNGRDYLFKGEYLLAEEQLKIEKDFRALAYLYFKKREYEKAITEYLGMETFGFRDMDRISECLEKVGEENELCYIILFELSMNKKYLKKIKTEKKFQLLYKKIVLYGKFGYGVLEKKEKDILECYFPFSIRGKKKVFLNLKMFDITETENIIYLNLR